MSDTPEQRAAAIMSQHLADNYLELEIASAIREAETRATEQFIGTIERMASGNVNSDYDEGYTDACAEIVAAIRARGGKQDER